MMDNPAPSQPDRRKDVIIIVTLIIVIIALVVVMILPYLGLSTNRGSTTGHSSGTSTSDYVAINLTNNQNISTPRNFDQLINIDWNQFQSYLNFNLDNVAFFSSPNFSTSNELYAWVENDASTAFASSNVWVNLSSNVVPAGGHLTIYMKFLNTSTGWSKYFGEAPSLSTVYGGHDNGQYVFPFYDNFAGSVLSTSKWQIVNEGGGVYSVKNGLTLGENYIATDMRVVTLHKYSGVVDAMVTGQNFASFRGTGIELATDMPTVANGFDDGYRFYASDNHPVGTVGGFVDVDVNGTGTTLAQNQNNPPGTPYVMSVSWPKTGKEFWSNNYNAYITASDSAVNDSPFFVSLYAGSDHSNEGTISFSFVRVRPMPPNNIMPVAQVGGLETIILSLGNIGSQQSTAASVQYGNSIMANTVSSLSGRHANGGLIAVSERFENTMARSVY